MSSSRGWSTPWKGLAWKRWSLDGGEVEIFSEVLRWIVDLKCYEIHRSWAHVFGSVFWRSWSEFKNQVWSLTPGRIWIAIKQKTTGGNISATATQQPTRNWLAHLERLGSGPWGCWQRAKVLQEKNQARLKNVGNVCVCVFFGNGLDFDLNCETTVFLYGISWEHTLRCVKDHCYVLLWDSSPLNQPLRKMRLFFSQIFQKDDEAVKYTAVIPISI